MIRIHNLKLPIDFTEAELRQSVIRKLRLKADDLGTVTLEKKSLDARKKEDILYICTVLAVVRNEKSILQRAAHGHSSEIEAFSPAPYILPQHGDRQLQHRPVIIGTGPAGLFAGLTLAEAGFCPVLLERGDEARRRLSRVTEFWDGGSLDPECNVQFGEGGAGTFSDGKLNTMVRDPLHHSRHVLETFVRFGAPEEILYLQKPHIGTDLLVSIVTALREEIVRLGGEVRFRTRFDRILREDGHLAAVGMTQEGKQEILPAEVVILAPGHSARDTFTLLAEEQIAMERKAFAIGLRIEHSQELIGRSQYGEAFRQLPPADYKLTHQTAAGRGVYSFCMCPGGFVVNASSEPGMLAVNGMSNYRRDSGNANSALVVTVTPADFGEEGGVLAGVQFQRKYERAAFQAAGGKIPLQLSGDFRRGVISGGFGTLQPSMKGSYGFANLRDCLPGFVSDTIAEGIACFDKKIRGFGAEDAILSGVETRTSSPVRILRDPASLEAVSLPGLYPCGEGAGFAGGITSAAMDGILTAEKIIADFDLPRCTKEAVHHG